MRSYMGLTASIVSGGSENAKVITATLINALLANGGTSTWQGGAIVQLERHWLSVDPDGTIEMGAYEG